MSYMLNESNFSEFSKKIVKNLKKENVEVKLSTMKDVISKSIGFNNFHCAKKEDFSIKPSIQSKKFFLSPFNRELFKIEELFYKKNKEAFNFQKNLTQVSSDALFDALSMLKNNPNLYELNLNNWINELVDRCGGFGEANRLFIFLTFIMEVKNSKVGSEKDILGRLFIKKLRNEVPKWIAEMFFDNGLEAFKKECFHYHFDIVYIDEGREYEYDFNDPKSCLDFIENKVSWDFVVSMCFTIYNKESGEETYLDDVVDVIKELKSKI